MHQKAILFVQDLAVILLIASVMTVLCRRFKQPIVLGYIIAGIIIGPYTPPFAYIQDQNTIKILGELGVVFLMFALGLEFNLRKLSAVLWSALLTALIEISFMTSIGYGFAKLLHWNTIDALFLGAIVAISSTTIIVKALHDVGIKHKHFAQLIYGVLIVEDIFAIAILGLLSSIAITGAWQGSDVVMTVSKLGSFLVVSLVFGILVIPRLLNYIAKLKSKEVLLICTLGICFGFCLLVIQFNYSIALGAFVSGAIIAESKQHMDVETMMLPLRDMFSAIFFISVGLLFDPAMITQYMWPIIGITLVVVIGKIVSSAFGMLLAGESGKTAVRVGMGMAQIGEFSFIIAALGVSLGVTSSFIYPMVVVVSSVTTLLTPYLIQYSAGFEKHIAKGIPGGVARFFENYRILIFNAKHKHGSQSPVAYWTLQVVINLFIIMAIFFSCAYFSKTPWGMALLDMTNIFVQKGILWMSALILSLPCIIAAYRKMKALSIYLMAGPDEANQEPKSKQLTYQLVLEVIPILILMSILLFISALSVSIFPPFEVFVFTLITVMILIAFLYRWFIKLYRQLKNAFLDTLEKK